ncbi:MAG: hypothetical protein AAFQ42_10895 [Pseudomonadota bacterium]
MGSEHLHITNGDSAAGLLWEAGVAGDVLAWRDPMHHGPFPLDATPSQLNRLRGDYLSMPGIAAAAITADFNARDAAVKEAVRIGIPITLWFEHDLLDQLQLVQVLDMLGTSCVAFGNVELICIGDHPGLTPFCGLGQLSPAQLAALIPAAVPVSAAHIEAASRAWHAFRSPDPIALAELLSTERMHSQVTGAEPAGAGTPELPFLSPALARHLEEFPWRCDGLSRTERQILQLVADGETRIGPVFTRNMDLETHLFVGDWHTFSVIDRLCAVPRALLTVEQGEWLPFSSPFDRAHRERYCAQRLCLTDTGAALLRDGDETPRPTRNDFWLGGVEWHPEQAMWFWDHAVQKPVLRAAPRI